MAMGRYWATMTKAQQKACLDLWKRGNWKIESYMKFRRRFRIHAIGGYEGSYYGGELWGMFIGIEQDGYTHS